MLIIRSPLRISLGGGGTDLPSYYEKFESDFIAAAIDKYVYVAINKPFEKGIFLKYSKQEECSSIDEIKHPLIRACFRIMKLDDPQIEISSMADIPSGTGLGSSGSFTAALLKGLHEFFELDVSNEKIAELACKVEIEILKDPVGKQDQYISALGGVKSFHIDHNGNVTHRELNLTNDTKFQLENNLLLFFTGITRSASSILSDQQRRSSDTSMQSNLHQTKNLGLKSRDYLENGNLELFAQLLTDQWEQKRSRSPKSSSDSIDTAIHKGLASGASGGKLIGAGGGGFLLFYSVEKTMLRSAMSDLGLEEVNFAFDSVGTKVLNR